MSNSRQRSEAGEQRPAVGDLLDRQYHDIGIPAVAAALRCLRDADVQASPAHDAKPTAGKPV